MAWRLCEYSYWSSNTYGFLSATLKPILFIFSTSENILTHSSSSFFVRAFKVKQRCVNSSLNVNCQPEDVLLVSSTLYFFWISTMDRI